MGKKIYVFFISALAAVILCHQPTRAADNPPVPPVRGDSAVTAPTPQPPMSETTATMGNPSAPSSIKRDSAGVPTLVVEFERDHSDIPPAFYSHMNAFGDYLKEHPNTTASLTGHADNSGHGPANGALSQKRADTVAAYLMTHYAIDRTRIRAEGAGAITDKASNITSAARQADRRVYGTINSKS